VIDVILPPDVKPIGIRSSPRCNGRPPVQDVFRNKNAMNTPTSRSHLRSLALASLVAVTGLLMSACSTITVDIPKAEKPVAYEDLHNMMRKLANEPTSADAAHLLDTAGVSVAASASVTTASNP